MTNSGRSVVVAIGILAIATLATVLIRERNKKTMFAMYADLHNLATSQDAYFVDHATYAPELNFTPTHGAAVRITYANDTGFAATATHPSTSSACYFTYAEPRGATNSQRVDARVAAWKAYTCK